MVHSHSGTTTGEPAQRPPSAPESGADDDWDVVDPVTAVPLRAAKSPDGDGDVGGPAMPDSEASKDRISFVLVGDTARFGSTEALSKDPVAAEETPTGDGVSSPPAADAAAPEADCLPSARDADVDTDVGLPAAPQRSDSPAAPSVDEAPPLPQDAALEGARAKLADAPSLPGVASDATNAPPLLLTAWRLREAGTLASEEQAARLCVAQDAEREYQRLRNEVRTERSRLADSLTATDEEIARRLQLVEDRAAAEAAARQRHADDQAAAAASVIALKDAERARARAGVVKPRRCDCLGASSGVHRSTCPLRDP